MISTVEGNRKCGATLPSKIANVLWYDINSHYVQYKLFLSDLWFICDNDLHKCSCCGKIRAYDENPIQDMHEKNIYTY